MVVYGHHHQVSRSNSICFHRHYYITIGGNTWIQTSAPFLTWTSIVSDSTGATLVAGANYYGAGGGIYKSTSGGSSWSLTSAPSGTSVGWLAIAIDSTGSIIIIIICHHYHHSMSPFLSLLSLLLGTYLAACSDFKKVSAYDSGGGPIYTSNTGTYILSISIYFHYRYHYHYLRGRYLDNKLFSNVIREF